MRVLVLGASGGCGRHVVTQARERRHDVTAIYRADPGRGLPDGVRVVLDDVQREGALDVVTGHDTVLSCIGLRRKNPRNPWSKLVSPVDFASRVTRSLVAAMKRHGVKRLLAISAAGVGDSAAGLNLPMRFFLRTSNVGVAYRDLDRMETALAESGLDWHAPRPVVLKDGPVSGRVRVIEDFPMTATISRADVAAWLIARMEDGRFEPRTPILSA